MPTKNSLLFFRDQINQIDQNIIKLLGERKNLVLKIAESKIKNKQAIRDLEREKKMLNELTILGKKNHLKSEYITKLFKLIIEESVLTQKKILKKILYKNNLNNSRFSILGPKGSYSYLAACEYADHIFHKYSIKECSTFEEVITSVETHQADYAILPIENTCSGIINEVINLLQHTNLFIFGEINMFINHCLLAIESIELDKIQKIYSHPQPFKQCSNFIQQFPKWKIQYTKSTADAMKKILKYNQNTNAALGSEIGGKIYGLKILSKNLSNIEKNITRFIILNQRPIKIFENIPTKTTLIFTIEKEPQNFSRIFSILQEKNIIIKKITSQVLNKHSSEKICYVDIQLNLSSKLMQDTLKKIQKITKFIKVLGCYPCENIIPIID